MSRGMGRAGALLLVGGWCLVAAPGRTAEPNNNMIPVSTTSNATGELQTLAVPPNLNSTAVFVGVDAISTTTDVDYITVSCMGLPLKEVGIDGFTNDIDLKVYDLAGNFVGLSAGVTSSESVDVTALGKDVLYLKVYGYLGAMTSSYSVVVRC